MFTGAVAITSPSSFFLKVSSSPGCFVEMIIFLCAHKSTHLMETLSVLVQVVINKLVSLYIQQLSRTRLEKWFQTPVGPILFDSCFPAVEFMRFLILINLMNVSNRLILFVQKKLQSPRLVKRSILICMLALEFWVVYTDCSDIWGLFATCFIDRTSVCVKVARVHTLANYLYIQWATVKDS